VIPSHPQTGAQIAGHMTFKSMSVESTHVNTCEEALNPMNAKRVKRNNLIFFIVCFFIFYLFFY
jgi:hypothetical protein